MMTAVIGPLDSLLLLIVRTYASNVLLTLVYSTMVLITRPHSLRKEFGSLDGPTLLLKSTLTVLEVSYGDNMS
jgi:hypothetical protein